MQVFFGTYYPWILSIHMVAVISWMAGLLYLPRLFVYHAGVEVGSDQDRLFQVMEARLLRIIMNPAMVLTWVFGGMMLMALGGGGAGSDAGGWLHVKMVAVVLLTAFHMALARWRRQFSEGKNTRPEKFYRMVNELPTLLMILIVVMVIVKPF